MVLDCPLVKLMIIVDQSEGSVLFLDEEEGSGIGTFRGSDVAFS